MSQFRTITPPSPDTNVPARQCGRCREKFEDAASADLIHAAEWWLCADCRRVLLPRQAAFVEGEMSQRSLGTK